MEAFQLDPTGVQYDTPVLLCQDIYAERIKKMGLGFFPT